MKGGEREMGRELEGGEGEEGCTHDVLSTPP